MNRVELTIHLFSGKLIVFEGTDGAGKTTLINKTYNYLKNKYPKKEIMLIKQPTDAARNTYMFQKMMFNKNHEDINYRAVQLLTLSDRIQHNSEIIIPSLMDGKIILCDRYIYTSIANMLGRHYRKEYWFFDVCKEIVKPDITFLAYIEPELAIKRIKSREEEKDRYFDEKLLYRVSNEFLHLAVSEKMEVLDTSSSAEYPFNLIKKALERIGL